MTKDDIFKIIRPVMGHCGCDKDADAAADAILPVINKMETALRQISENGDTWGGEGCARHAWMGLHRRQVK